MASSSDPTESFLTRLDRRLRQPASAGMGSPPVVLGNPPAKLPRWLESGDSAYEWALENMDIGNDIEENPEYAVHYREVADEYVYMAEDVAAEGKVVIYRVVRLDYATEKDIFEKIDFRCIGRAWSHCESGAGVQGCVPEEHHHGKDVLMVGLVGAKYIDWEASFIGWMYYHDECEITLKQHAPLLVTHVNGRELRKPIKANTGTSGEVWKATCHEVRDNPGVYTSAYVAQHLRDVDGTGDEEFVDSLVGTVEEYPQWALVSADPTQFEHMVSPEDKTARRYASMGTKGMPPIVVVPEEPSTGLAVLDGAHRAMAAQLLNEPVMAFVPVEVAGEVKRANPSPSTLDTKDLPRALGSALYKLIRTDEAFAIIDHDISTRHSDWGRGGCTLLSEALLQWYGPSARRYMIVVGSIPAPQHAVTKIGSFHYDNDGASTERALLQRWKRLENLKDPRLVSDENLYKSWERQREERGIQHTPQQTKMLLDLLRRGLGSPERWAFHG